MAGTEIERPRVVVSVIASADGRVALNREQVLMDEPSGRLFRSMEPPNPQAVDDAPNAEIERQYQPTVHLEGSGSFVTDAAGSLADLPEVDDPTADLHTDFLPSEVAEKPSPPHKWLAVVNSRGRIRWQYTSSGEFDLLVLVARATSAKYLAYLRRERASYLVVGDDGVDLETALLRMANRLGVRCVLSTGGGGLNGALLRAGLVDEVHFTLLPALIGGLTTPSMFDGPSLAIGESPTPLRLLSVHTERAGTVRLSYEVQR